MLPTVGATRRPVPYQILGRTRRHVVVGRVVTPPNCRVARGRRATERILSKAVAAVSAGIAMLSVIGRRSINE